MAETLFPQRQRCKTCRGNLGRTTQDPVLLGLYCTPKCAGRARPATSPNDAPRECVTQRDGRWSWKRRYRSESEIPERILAQPTTDHYWCQHCSHLHIGRAQVDMERTSTRGLRNRADIADLLVKKRGGVPHKQVAEVAGVRPIRIKEWEDPTFDTPSMMALFAVLRLYRMDIAAVFKPANPR